MTILWLTWKDAHHPAAGGAEIVASELCKRLVRDGHRVTMLTCGYAGAPAEEIMADGIHIIRVGSNRYSHPIQALLYYMRRLRGRCDLLIEEVNGGVPYFSAMFAGKSKRLMLYHQLARINWLYEMRRPISHLGYYGLVPLVTRLSGLSGAPTITVSESTRRTLASHGFNPRNIRIISEGITMPPLEKLQNVTKYVQPTVLSLGAMRAMKRTLHQIAAFEIAKKRIPNLQLKVAGAADTAYGRRVLARIEASAHRGSIEYLGHVSAGDKRRLMQQSHLILQTAIEEGWGLTITEAASQGTPAIAYNVAGLRDSIRHQRTGLLTPEHPQALAEGIVAALTDSTKYETMRSNGWEWSKLITFDKSYEDFMTVVSAL